jgi:Spy/CpxP family protein refolding chaperone
MKTTIRPHLFFKMALPAILATGIFTTTLNAAPDAAKSDPALAQQLSQARTKAAQLEILFAQNVPRPTATPAAAAPPMPNMPNMPNMAASPAPAPPMPNMSPPGAMKPSGMGDDKMMGMMNKMMPMMEKMMPMMEKMMGAMPPAAPAAPMSMGDDQMEMMGMSPMGSNASAAMPSSASPGFPGASRLYHCGATGFFLDHQQYITLTTEQQVALNKIKDQALLAKSAAERNIEKAEQELWTLTAADQPDSGKIEAKVREVEKLRANERLAFMGAVGEAAKLLTADQRKSLTGFAPPAPAMPMTPPAAPDTPMPMKDM